MFALNGHDTLDIPQGKHLHDGQLRQHKILLPGQGTISMERDQTVPLGFTTMLTRVSCQRARQVHSRSGAVHITNL